MNILNPSLVLENSRRKFSKEESFKIKEGVLKNMTWTQMASNIFNGERTAFQCRKHYQTILRQSHWPARKAILKVKREKMREEKVKIESIIKQ